MPVSKLIDDAVNDHYERITLTIKPRFILIHEDDFQILSANKYYNEKHLKINFNEKESRREYTYDGIPLVRTKDITQGTIKVIN